MRSLVVALVLCTASVAVAEDRITDGTAYTLDPGDVRVGVLRSGFGLPAPKRLSGLEISTFPLPWLAYLANGDDVGVKFVNGQVKMSRDLAPRWMGSLTLTGLYGRIGDKDASGTFFALPLEAHVNYDVSDKLTVGGLLQFTYVSIGAEATQSDLDEEEIDEDLENDDPEKLSFEGAARTDTAHLGLTAEYRAFGWLALITEARLTRFGRVTADGQGAAVVDEFTTVEVFGQASAAPAKWGYSVRAITHLGLGWAQLRLGVSYGNFVLPMLNLAVPVRYVMPTANLYLRI